MAAGTERRSAQERTALAAALAFALLLACGGIALPRLRTAEPAPEPMPRPMVEPAEIQPPRSEPVSEPVTERTVAIAPGSVRAFCRLRRRIAGTDRAPAYVGAFAIEDDGGSPLLDGATVNSDEVAFALPRAAKAVTVRAAGYRPATVAVAIDRDAAGDTADFGEIALEPDAQLRFVVRGLPATAAARLRLGVACGQESFSWSGACDADGAATVAVPSGRALHWQLAAQGTGVAFQTGGDAPVLAREEHRDVLVDTAAIPAQRFRVEGLSHELLPHLSVRGRQNGGFLRIALDDEGRGCLRSDLAEDAPYLELDGQDVALRASTGTAALVAGAPGETVLHPAEPVVGVQLRAADGALVPFWLAPDARALPPRLPLQPVCVRRAAELRDAGRLTVWSEATGTLRFAPAVLDGLGDFVTLDARLGAPLATLQIAVGGERPRAPCDVQVLTPAGAALCTANVEGAPPTAVVQGLDAGSYDLRWRIGREPDAWIARGVVLAAGQHRELAASWPVRTPWHGEVAGWADLPPGRRWHTLSFGGQPSMFFGPQRLPIDRDGRFQLELPPEAAPPRAVEFFHGFMHLPGEVVDVDRAQARIVVQPPRDVRWVELCVQGDADWLAYVWRPTNDPARPELWMTRRSDQRPLLVPPGVVLTVEVHEVVTTGFGRTIGLLAIDGTEPRVVVRADAGHWIDVVGHAGATVALLGPQGPGMTCTLDAGGRTRLWVPDGARGVRCWQQRTDPPSPFTDRPVPAALLDLR